MSVYKPKNSPYYQYDFRWQGNRFFGTTGCTAKRSAEAYEARVRQKVILPDNAREIITLDLAAGLYQEHAEHLPSWSLSEFVIKALIKGLGGNKLLGEVSQRDLQAHFARRRNGRKNSSVNREITVARAVWRKASKARFDVGEMPDWKALMLKVDEVDPRELSFEEEDRLLPALREDVASVVDFALKSGWRRNEVTTLTWANVNLQTGQATTRIKGGSTIKRPLTPTLVAIIANQPKVGPFVFTYVCRKNRLKRRAGERYPVSNTVLRKAMVAAMTDAGIEGFRFHDLRHTRGTRIVRSTGSLAAAKRALAHKSINTTLRYAHVLDDDVRNALDASDERNACKGRDVTLYKKA